MHVLLMPPKKNNTVKIVFIYFYIACHSIQEGLSPSTKIPTHSFDVLILYLSILKGYLEGGWLH